MFEKASRLKLRFGTSRGNITTEDVWDLPLTSPNGACLDDLAKSLNKAVKDSGEESFVVKRNTVNTTLALKFDIVKHIIKVKLEELEARETAAATKAKKEKILNIIADKEDDSLKNTSVDKLKEMLADL
jgi:chemotaxis signal transduction protein